MKVFIRIAAAYFIAIGLVSLLVPQVASGQLGHSLSAFDVFVARSLGAAVTAIGIADWSVSSKKGELLRGLFAANIFANISLAAIDILAINQGVIGASSWFGITMHGVLSVGFIYSLLRNNK